jgi:hypothetical protein
MLVWGRKRDGVVNVGGRYQPVDNVWTALPLVGAPPVRSGHTAVWTGGAMMIWGGIDSGYFNDTWSFTPGRVMFLYEKL